jgi:phage/conjugal plasmid C-4 type zinc finger TraR family protein
VQEQIDATIADGVARARSRLGAGESLEHCEQCDEPIPEPRRRAVPGVRRCVGCQAELDATRTATAGYNRRANKDSQLK